MIEFCDLLQIGYNWRNKLDKFKYSLTQIVYLFHYENFNHNLIHLFIPIEVIYLIGH